MLELDLQLLPFLEHSFASLEDSEKEGYEKLLLEEDWQIYDWLRGVTKPLDENVELVVDKIIRFQLEK